MSNFGHNWNDLELGFQELKLWGGVRGGKGERRGEDEEEEGRSRETR